MLLVSLVDIGIVGTCATDDETVVEVARLTEGDRASLPGGQNRILFGRSKG